MKKLEIPFKAKDKFAFRGFTLKLPESTLDKLSNWSTKNSNLSELRNIMLASFLSSGERSLSSQLSKGPFISVSGVLNSCETFPKNLDFISFTFSNSLLIFNPL